MQLDLADLASVRVFAQRFDAEYKRLDILINNAGVMNCTFGKTKDGFELQFGTNHLGHFLLTLLLLDKLKASAPARIVNMSSIGHSKVPDAIGTIYNDLDMENSYDGWAAYSRAKMSNILFSNALNRKLAGTGVTSYALHSGIIWTNLYHHTIGVRLFGFLMLPFIKNVQQGAATTVYCATFPALDSQGGKYFVDCHEAMPHHRVLDQKLQDDLWDLRFQLTGLQ